MAINYWRSDRLRCGSYKINTSFAIMSHQPDCKVKLYFASKVQPKPLLTALGTSLDES